MNQLRTPRISISRGPVPPNTATCIGFVLYAAASTSRTATRCSSR